MSLKNLCDITDIFKFRSSIANISSHRHLLLWALENTTGPVLELGMGFGSTIHLHNYCQYHDRALRSYDNNQEWFRKFEHLKTPLHSLTCNDGYWNRADLIPPGADKWSVVLVDHAPGERRHVDIKKLANQAQLLVVHDSEPYNSGYLLHDVWPLFKYKLDQPYDGAWTTIVSNFIDVTTIKF